MTYVALTPLTAFSTIPSTWLAQLLANTAALHDGSGFATNAIPASALATNAIKLGSASITGNLTTSSTSSVQATGLSCAVTIPTGGRDVIIHAFMAAFGNSIPANGSFVTIWDGPVGSGAQLAQSNKVPGSNEFCICEAYLQSPSAGSKTFSLGFGTVTSGTTTLTASSVSKAFMIVELK